MNTGIKAQPTKNILWALPNSTRYEGFFVIYALPCELNNLPLEGKTSILILYKPPQYLTASCSMQEILIEFFLVNYPFLIDFGVDFVLILSFVHQCLTIPFGRLLLSPAILKGITIIAPFSSPELFQLQNLKIPVNFCG